MQYGNLTIKIVRSNNPQTKDYYRINSAYDSKPTYKNSLYKTGDIIEPELLDNINLINRIIKHDRINVTVATEGKHKSPVINRDTIDNIKHYYNVSEC